MTNREKFKEQILNIACNGCQLAVDENTMEPIECGTHKTCKRCLFNKKTTGCRQLRKEWCEADYNEPHVDWSKVPVDTPILVSEYDDGFAWERRHFAKFQNGQVYAWAEGRTSWSAKSKCMSWEYVKLAEDGDKP